ncbi:MAG: OmpA family protein [Sulfurimonas sp.]
MMKNILFSVTAIWFVVGCAQPAPDLQGNMSDTITIDENNLNSDSSGSLYNSSSDGFVSVYFDFDGYSIVPSQEGRILQNANRLRSVAGNKVKIEGNCDEFGTDEYNYALGLKRAKAIKDALADQGVNTSNIVMVSYGESNPVCYEPTDECYARNRRVDLRLAK